MYEGKVLMDMIFSIIVRKKYLYGAFKIIFSPETFSTSLGHTGDNLERRFRRHLGGRGLILIQSKIPFECTKSLALGCYSQDFTKKNYRVVFEKSSLYFTFHMKISKSKSNNKTPQNPFNFDSIKNSFWVHN